MLKLPPMKHLLSAILLLISAGFALAGSVVLEGRYQQRNVFVINSVSEDGVGFCVYEVTVNGQVTSDEINSQAFEIDLTILGLKVGDPVTCVIKHKDGCAPKILNPGALEPAPSFDCKKIEVNGQGLLIWETTGEMGKLPYTIQQFKWNKWVNVGEVMGNGTSTKNTYSFQTSLVSGLNRFRVVQKSYEGELRKSLECEVNNPSAPITFAYNKKSKTISFSGNTSYELYNSFGQIIKRGVGNTLDASSFEKGEYHISYDNRTEKKKKK